MGGNETFDVGSRSSSSISSSTGSTVPSPNLSYTASCAYGSASLPPLQQQQQQISTPLPSAAAAALTAATAAAAAVASAPQVTTGALTCFHSFSPLSSCETSSFSVVSAEETAADSSATVGAGTDNPFAFHARSRLLTSKTQLLHPPTLSSSFSAAPVAAAAAGGTEECGHETDISRRRRASFSFCTGRQYSNLSSSYIPFNRGRRDTEDGSLRLLLPPSFSPGERLARGAAGVGQSVSTTDSSSNSNTTDSSSNSSTADSSSKSSTTDSSSNRSSNSSTTDRSSCTTDSSSCITDSNTSHSVHTIGGGGGCNSSPILSFSMPATPRLYFQSPGTPQHTAAYAIYPPACGAPDAVSVSNTTTTATGTTVGETRATTGLYPFTFPPTVISQSSTAAVAARAWPAKRRRSIHVDGSTTKSYTLSPERQQQQLLQVQRASFAAVGEMQQASLRQQQSAVGSMSTHTQGNDKTRSSSSRTTMNWLQLPQQQQQQMAQEEEQATDQPPMTTLIDCEAIVSSSPLVDAAGNSEGVPRLIITQASQRAEGKGGEDMLRESKGDVKDNIYSPEEAMNTEEDKSNLLAASNAEADGGDDTAALAATASAESDTKPQQRLEFLDTGCYSVCYHTAMAAVPYSALSTDSAAAQLLQAQQELLLDREREARRRRKACLSVLRSVHNALIASPTGDTETSAGVRRCSSPAGGCYSSSAAVPSSFPSTVPFLESLSSSMKGSLHGSEFPFTAASSTSGAGAAAAAGDIVAGNPSSVRYTSLPSPPFSTFPRERQVPAVQQQQQQQFLLSISTVCSSSEGNQQQLQQNTAMDTSLDFSGNITEGPAAPAYNKVFDASSIGEFAASGADAPGGPSQSVSMESSIEQTRQEETSSVSKGASLSTSSTTGSMLRLRPDWLSPCTLAALIGACVHCYDVVRAAYPPPEPPPRLCLVSLPALYNQLPPHLMAGAVLLDEAALSLGSPPQCLPIECSLISLASSQDSAAGGSRGSSNNYGSGSSSDNGSGNNSGKGEHGEEKPVNVLPGNLLGQFDIIVCETRTVTLATVENVAACVKALSRRRRKARYGAGRKSTHRNAVIMQQQSDGSAQPNGGRDGGTFISMEETKDEHMQSTIRDNEEENAQNENREEGSEEVDVAAAALGCLSFLKPGQSVGGVTTSEKQLKEHQQLLQYQLQQQESFRRLPPSVRVIMLSTCLLSAVIDDLLGLKQCRFQPYVRSSALSSLQLQCIYANFQDYPLFHKHNDVDFTTRVRARRRGTCSSKAGGPRGRGTEGSESCGESQTGGGSTSSSGGETRTEAAGGGGLVPERCSDEARIDHLIFRALTFQAEQEARAAAHSSEGVGEAALVHSSTNDEFSSEKSGAEEDLDDATELKESEQRQELQGQSCQSCQRHRETATLLNAFESFHLQSSSTEATAVPQQQQQHLQREQEQFTVSQQSQENAQGRTTPAVCCSGACCVRDCRHLMGGNGQTVERETSSFLNKSCEILRSKAYRGITMRQGDDDEDDGIDYDLECGSHFGMVAHEL